MITDELLLQLGRLTIEFAQLDEAVSELVSDLLRCDEGEIARGIVLRMDFSRKVEMGRDLVRFYTEKGIPRDDPLPLNTLEALKRAGDVASARNSIIHSHVQFSLDGTKHAFVHHKKGKVDASEAAISALAEQAKKVTLLLLECWIGFNNRLDAVYSPSALRAEEDEYPGFAPNIAK